MAQMSKFASRFNQQIAVFLGDFKKEREPEENPSPTRAVFRIVFVVLILAGFVALLVHHFLGSPDVWVEQINLKDKKNFARCALYGGDDCKEAPFRFYHNVTTYVKRRPVVCPCNNTNVKWRDFVRFYTLHKNSTVWGVEFGNSESNEGERTIPWIHVPTLTEDNFTLLRDRVVKSTKDMITTDDFCDLTYYWPEWNAPVKYPKYVCEYMASTLLPVGPLAEFPINMINRTLEFFESPNLLSYEVFKIRIAERARESILKGRLDLDVINLYDRNFTKAYNLYANMLTQALDKIDTEEWCSYYRSAIELMEDLNFIKNMGDPNPWMIYLSEKRAHKLRLLHFLHLETDWEKYEIACDPLYCEETKKMGVFRQAYRAFGLLGGVATLVLGLVTALLWPAFGLLLSWCCNTPAAVESVIDEHPEAPFLPGGSGASVVSGNVPAANSGTSFRRRSSQKQAEPC